MYRESEFLLEVMANLTSSLDLNEVLSNTYSYLQEFFPLSGISLHKFLKQERQMQTLFIVNDDGCHFIENKYLMNDDEFASQIEVDTYNRADLLSLDMCKMRNFITNNLLVHVDNKNPSILATPLTTKKGITIGHMLFFSKVGTVFTKEHLEIFARIKDLFTSAMINIHHFRSVVSNNEKLRKENKVLNETIGHFTDKKIVGSSEKIQKVLENAEVLAKTELPILVLGETGTGKELIADYIQEHSARKNEKFIKVNCGALPDSLIDSELFGYVKGAFTGAYENKKGYFEQANGGTLFLDEIGELSLQAQVRLLRVLQFGLIERVGSSQSISVNVRIIAATNRNLEYMLQQGTFREDLYYRLQAFPVKLPPLRERKEDIYPLIHHVIAKVSAKFNLPKYPINTSCLEKMYHYSWPGNIRELENIVERAMILNKAEELCFEEYLPKDPLWYLDVNSEDCKKNLKEIIKECLLEMGVSQSIFQVGQQPYKNLDELLKEQILSALKQTNGKVSGKNSAAELLNLNPNTLRKRMEKLGISAKKIWDY